MRTADMLIAIASWLEGKDNEALLLAEHDELCMDQVAEACIKAASVLREAADKVDLMEGQRKLLVAETEHLLQSFAATPFGKNILSVALFDGEEKFAEVVGTASELLEKLQTVELPEGVEATVGVMAGQEGLDEIAKLAGVFDKSEDEKLHKVASVMDELLLTIAVDPDWSKSFKAAQKKQIDDLKRKYQDVKESLDKVLAVEDTKKAITDSKYYEVKRPLEAPLSQRACPDHQTPMSRVGEDTFQCPLDKKIYNWREGFTTEKGAKIPGGGVEEQTKINTHQPHTIFDNREDRMMGRSLK